MTKARPRHNMMGYTAWHLSRTAANFAIIAVKDMITKMQIIIIVYIGIVLAVCVEGMNIPKDAPITLVGVTPATCAKCNRQFYGEDCYQAHLLQFRKEETTLERELRKKVKTENDIEILPKETMKSVCEMYCKCKISLVSYLMKEGVEQKCGHGQCSNCLDFVDLYRHECHIFTECYRDNKRWENKQKAEERCLEADDVDYRWSYSSRYREEAYHLQRKRREGETGPSSQSSWK